MSDILIPVAILSGLGLAFGVMLGVAAKIFSVKTDERIEKITEILPGANCGGCGFTGCSAYANAIVTKNARINACPVGGEKTVDEISEVLGISPSEFIKTTARVKCIGSKDNALYKFEYEGISDCYAANKVGGGFKECPNGCLGLGTCVSVCMFDALSIVNGVAKVDKNKCTGCGACVKKCPRSLIEIVPFNKIYSVFCKNKEKGAVVKNQCKVGCIACKICEKNCPESAIKVTDNIAAIDYDKCTACGICVEKCPKKVILEF